ncbi:MAG: thiamine-phosphate kinase [Zoogloeaceae bacterium]|jgi:thiamine-monophosphate kinase|nr:thiamine-phosphate kinase [Zoogloeaceae bacterium]
MNEFDLIARHFQRPTPQTLLGPGDDSALIEVAPGMELAVSSDMLVAGVHFLPDTEPRDLGWKTLAVNLSDLAAMGARARWALLALSLPVADEAWLAAFSAGFFSCAQQFQVDLAGGDMSRMTRGGALSLCATVIGEVPTGQALRRDGAQAGDDVWLSGYPGLAALGLKHLQGKTVLPDALCRLCVHRLQAPVPRLLLGQLLRPLAHAAIDVSDGLMADVAHIAKKSRLAARIFLHRLPRPPQGVERALALESLLSGGDDYELAFTAGAQQRPAIAQIAAQLDLPLWRIGQMKADATTPAVQLIDSEGKIVPWEKQGYDHFLALPSFS